MSSLKKFIAHDLHAIKLAPQAIVRPPMERLNESRIAGVITPSFAARASTSTRSTLHAQHGVGIFVGLESDVTITAEDGATVSGRVVVVPPDLPHAAESPGPTLGLLYDPEAAAQVAGFARLRGGAFPLEGRLGARFREAACSHSASWFNTQVLDGLAREPMAWLAGEAPRRDLDKRVARLLEALRDPAGDRELALAQSGISQSHLQALFARDVGVPIRTYALWRRLLTALLAFTRRGVEATAAAHQAGFADLAHFSRTCRRMLGYCPTVLRDGDRASPPELRASG
jgi:AraC-like DNA-binding protein